MIFFTVGRVRVSVTRIGPVYHLPRFLATPNGTSCFVVDGNRVAFVGAAIAMESATSTNGFLVEPVPLLRGFVWAPVPTGIVFFLLSTNFLSRYGRWLTTLVPRSRGQLVVGALCPGAARLTCFRASRWPRHPFLQKAPTWGAVGHYALAYFSRFRAIAPIVRIGTLSIAAERNLYLCIARSVVVP